MSLPEVLLEQRWKRARPKGGTRKKGKERERERERKNAERVVALLSPHRGNRRHPVSRRCSSLPVMLISRVERYSLLEASLFVQPRSFFFLSFLFPCDLIFFFFFARTTRGRGFLFNGRFLIVDFLPNLIATDIYTRFERMLVFSFFFFLSFRWFCFIW